MTKMVDLIDPSNLENIDNTILVDDNSDSVSCTTNYNDIDPVLEKSWLMAAATCDYEKLSKILLQEEKFKNHRSFINGYSALHWAAKFGKDEIFRLLVGTYSADINIQDFNGMTPLHLAYLFGRNETRDTIQGRYEADNIRDYGGRFPQEYSNIQGYGDRSNSDNAFNKRGGNCASRSPAHLGILSPYVIIDECKFDDETNFYNLPQRNRCSSLMGIPNWSSSFISYNIYKQASNVWARLSGTSSTLFDSGTVENRNKRTTIASHVTQLGDTSYAIRMRNSQLLNSPSPISTSMPWHNSNVKQHSMSQIVSDKVDYSPKEINLGVNINPNTSNKDSKNATLSESSPSTSSHGSSKQKIKVESKITRIQSFFKGTKNKQHNSKGSKSLTMSAAPSQISEHEKSYDLENIEE